MQIAETSRFLLRKMPSGINESGSLSQGEKTEELANVLDTNEAPNVAEFPPSPKVKRWERNLRLLPNLTPVFQAGDEFVDLSGRVYDNLEAPQLDDFPEVGVKLTLPHPFNMFPAG
jgi:hypothetical protein